MIEAYLASGVTDPLVIVGKKSLEVRRRIATYLG